MTRHPRDPAAQHDAAATLGRMEADGLLPPGEAAQTLRVIVQPAQPLRPTTKSLSPQPMPQPEPTRTQETTP